MKNTSASAEAVEFTSPIDRWTFRNAQIAGEAEEVEEAAEVVEATTIFLSGFLKFKKFLTKFSNS